MTTYRNDGSLATELTDPDRIRVTDADRAAVAERLHKAIGDGSLTMGEYEERITGVWASQTWAELRGLIRDLPAPRAQMPDMLPSTPPTRRRSDTGRSALRVLTLIWAVLAVSDFVVWFLVCLTTLSFIYPWWIWTLVPGAALAVLWRHVGGRAGFSGRL